MRENQINANDFWDQDPTEIAKAYVREGRLDVNNEELLKMLKNIITPQKMAQVCHAAGIDTEIHSSPFAVLFIDLYESTKQSTTIYVKPDTLLDGSLPKEVMHVSLHPHKYYFQSDSEKLACYFNNIKNGHFFSALAKINQWGINKFPAIALPDGLPSLTNSITVISKAIENSSAANIRTAYVALGGKMETRIFAQIINKIMDYLPIINEIAIRPVADLNQALEIEYNSLLSAKNES